MPVLGILLVSSLLMLVVEANGECPTSVNIRNGCFRGYCPGQDYTGSKCIDGFCRCPNNPRRDYCTCLATSGSCRIEQGAPSPVGIPIVRGQVQTTYSCSANENCLYDVHVISNYEGDYNSGYSLITRRAGNTNVHLRVGGENSKPLVLVFVSHEPVNWNLYIPPGVVVDKILLGSKNLARSGITYSPHSTVLSVEKLDYLTLPFGYGRDNGFDGQTDKLLEYIVGRFGPVASFTGSYTAKEWTLNIQRHELPSECSSSGESHLSFFAQN